MFETLQPNTEKCLNRIWLSWREKHETFIISPFIIPPLTHNCWQVARKENFHSISHWGVSMCLHKTVMTRIMKDNEKIHKRTVHHSTALVRQFKHDQTQQQTRVCIIIEQQRGPSYSSQHIPHLSAQFVLQDDSSCQFYVTHKYWAQLKNLNYAGMAKKDWSLSYIGNEMHWCWCLNSIHSLQTLIFPNSIQL